MTFRFEKGDMVKFIDEANVCPGDPVPVHRHNYIYYLEANATFPHDKTMRDFINENDLSYVHELQHYLRKHYRTDNLKIHI